MSSDLFSKGCLVQLETSAWTARAKVSSKALLNGDHADIDPAYVNASKRLVDGESLRSVESIRGEARAWLATQSLPFPLDGAVFVPSNQIERIDAKLAEYRAKYEEATDAFASDYAVLREAARARLGSLYSETDYPVEIRRRFSFSWRFLSLAPASEAQLVNPKLVAQEREKFQRLMAEAAEGAVTELRTRFAACVDHVVERLAPTDDGKPRVFRESLVGNLKDFLDGFAGLNVCDDRQLATLVERARATIDGVDAPALRSSEGLRGQVAARMADVSAALDGMIVDRPSRKVRLAPSAASPEAS